MTEKKESSSLFSKIRSSRIFCTGSVDTWFFVAVIALLCIGLVMMFSASYPFAYTRRGDSLFFIKRQILFAVLGLAAMLLFSHISPEFWKKITKFIMFIAVVLLVVVLMLPGTEDGFHRWIDVGPISIQPSEVAKFAIIIFGAYIYGKYYKNMNKSKPAQTWFALRFNKAFHGNIIRESWIPTWRFGFFLLMFAVLVFAEKHLSGCILIVAIGIVMLYLGGLDEKWLIILFVVGVIAVVLVCAYVIKSYDPESGEFNAKILSKYMCKRIYAWWNKDFEPTDDRWQTNQGIYAIGSGGLFGKGLGNSTQKYMYVAEPQNDMIFTIVCEELGFVGASLIILLFVFLVYRGIVIGLSAKTKFGSFLAMGLVFQIGLQVFLNIAVATDIIPNTGIGLPFFSYGGSSMVMLLSEMGIIMAVSRTGRLKKK